MFSISFKEILYAHKKPGGIRQNCKYALFNILILSVPVHNTDEGVRDVERGGVWGGGGFVHDAQTNRVVSIRLIFFPLFFILHDLLGEEPLTNNTACQQQRPIRFDVLLCFLATCFLYFFNTELINEKQKKKKYRIIYRLK